MYSREYLEMDHIGTYTDSAFSALKVYQIDEHDHGKHQNDTSRAAVLHDTRAPNPS